MKRLIWIDAAKGLSMVLVVLLHCAGWYSFGRNLGHTEWYALSENLISLRMPLFFLVSGLLISKSLTSTKGKVCSRALNLYSVYLIWTIIHSSRLIYFPSASNITFAPDLIFWNAISPGLYWYIWALPLFYVGTAILFARWNNPDKVPAYIYLSLVLSGIAAFFNRDIANVWSETLDLNSRIEFFYTDSIFKNYIWFLVGAVFSQHIRVISERIPTLGVRAVLGGTTLILFGISIANIDEHIRLLISPIFLVSGTIILLRRFESSKTSAILSKVGSDTLPIYIFHWLTLNIFTFIVSRFTDIEFPTWAGWIIPVAMTVFIIPFNVAIGRILRNAKFGFLLDGVASGLSTRARASRPSTASVERAADTIHRAHDPSGDATTISPRAEW